MTRRPFLPIYVPALRLKQGEYRGLQRLAPDVSEKILPRLVLPPSKEVDPEKGRLLTKDEIIYGTGRRIAAHWPMRSALLEAEYVFKEFGEAESSDWLPRIFLTARKAGASLIPVATLSDILGHRGSAFLKTIDFESPTRIAIRIEAGEIDKDVGPRVAASMAVLGVMPSQCIVLADFAESDFSDVDAVADVVQYALEELQAAGRWHQIVFQGSNYPEKNPAPDNGEAGIPRSEWAVWKRVIKFDANASDHLVFGDYGADCARFEFRNGGGGIPIRHYRYATPDKWLVVRGVPTGDAKSVMKDVCSRILKSGQFAGRTFSSADEYIYQTAKFDGGPGSGSTWREINTAHHITRVVRDIGGVRGFSFKDFTVHDPSEQRTLFDSVS